jgi:hypothetical protein
MFPTTKSVEIGQNTKLRTGLPLVFARSATFQIEGEEVKLSAFLDLLDTLSANAQSVDDANVAYHRAVAVETEARTKARQKLSALRSQLQSRLSPEQLVTCGLAPKKKARELTADERAVKTAKLRATREANGTAGVRQARAEKAKAALRATFAPRETGGAPDAPSTSGGHDGGGSGPR